MKNVLYILKKEFVRFFKDRRMRLSIILPGILIYVLYSLIGTVVKDKTKTEANYTPTAYVINTPTSLSEQLKLVYNISDKTLTEEEAKTAVENKDIDILIVFPLNFDAVLNGEDNSTPDIQIFYNSSSQHSSTGFNIANTLLQTINKTAFTINMQNNKYDLADDKVVMATILSTMIPMLMFALLASGCMAVAPEAIAGEKERGTMATLLITPVKRWQIALGKIISLSVFALLSGLSSFLGVILSLPKLTMGAIGSNAATLYSVGHYFMIFGIIISVVLVIISAFSVISCFARTVKESTSLITPLMIVIILMGMASMFISGSPAIGFYLIPLFGSGIAIANIMAFTISPLAVVFSIISNLVVAVLLIVLLSKMFKSEKVMFKK